MNYEKELYKNINKVLKKSEIENALPIKYPNNFKNNIDAVRVFRSKYKKNIEINKKYIL